MRAVSISKTRRTILQDALEVAEAFAVTYGDAHRQARVQQMRQSVQQTKMNLSPEDATILYEVLSLRQSVPDPAREALKNTLCVVLSGGI